MDNPWDEVKAAVSQHRDMQAALRDSTKAMAGLLRGNLRHATHSDLAALKKELAKYNIHTGRWQP